MVTVNSCSLYQMRSLTELRGSGLVGICHFSFTFFSSCTISHKLLKYDISHSQNPREFTLESKVKHMVALL